MNTLEDIKETLISLFQKDTGNYKTSTRWKEYHLGETLTHCLTCFERNNKIYDVANLPILPEHER